MIGVCLEIRQHFIHSPARTPEAVPTFSMKPYYTLADLLDEEHPFDAGETVPARLAVIGFPIAHSKSPAMQQAAQDGAALAVFPELGLTGYTCSDLFLQQPLLDALQRQGLADEILLWEAFSRMRTIDWGRENATATGAAAGDRERSGVL